MRSPWAGIAVPVPRAAEVTARLDHSEVLDPGLAQTRARQEPSEPTPDDRDLDLICQGFPLEPGFHVGIVQVSGKVARDLQVLSVAVRAEPLIALLSVLLAQGIGIKAQVCMLRPRG